jgi:crotonobetainyl-CoA hydratase
VKDRLDMDEAAESPRPPLEPFGEPVEGLKVRRSERVLEVILDRPERRNALTPVVIEGLLGLLDVVDRSHEFRAIILRGAGGKAFCAGFDITQIQSQGGVSAGTERDLVDHLSTRVAEVGVPVIAGVDGAAVGAGCDLAVACDIRIGSPIARFGMPPVKLGILYGQRGILRLISTIGPTAAREMLLTGSLVEAARATETGLLNKVVPADRLVEECWSLAEVIAANAPLSVTGTKRIIRLLTTSADIPADAQAEIDDIQRAVWTSQDAQEGSRAYMERRAPRYIGA